MAISADTTYRLIFAQLSFARNEPFLKKLQATHGVEIPYLDYAHLPAEQRDHLDTYTYLPDDEDFRARYSKLNRSYPQVGFTDLGRVSGKSILDMLGAAAPNNAETLQIDAHYKLTAGPFKNLQVQLTSVAGEDAVVRYPLLGSERTLHIPTNHLELIETPLNPWSGFRNLMDLEVSRGNRNAVIIDGSFALHRAMYGNDKLYTKSKKFIGGCSGFYFDLLRLKELYPEYEIHVIFDGYDRRKFENNPDYKAHRAGFGTRLRQAYGENQDWCERLTRALGYHLYKLNDKEGDDIIGSLATHLTRDRGYNHALIFSVDTDFFQLVSDKIHLHMPKQSFRGNSITIRPEDAREHFTANVGGIKTPLNRNDKINWYRALHGDTSDNILSINKYVHKVTGVMTKYQGTHYLPIINEAETLEACKAGLLADSRFEDFVTDGQFDTNLKLLTINTELFSTETNFGQYGSTFEQDTLEALLVEISFFKELEQLPKVSRIFQGVW